MPDDPPNRVGNSPRDVAVVLTGRPQVQGVDDAQAASRCPVGARALARVTGGHNEDVRLVVVRQLHAGDVHAHDGVGVPPPRGDVS